MSAFYKSKVKKDDDADVEETEVSNALEKKDIVENEAEFDINPMKKTCDYCKVEVVTYVEHEAHPLFLLIAILVFIVFGYLAFLILPITYMVTKNAVHRCSRCLQKMGEKSCFGLPNDFRDEIWQIRLGKCSIVVARCYAIVAILCFLVFSFYYISMRPSVFNHIHAYETPKDSKEIYTSWDEFLKDCGGEIIVENYVHAKTVFNNKYEQNIVTWEGYFAETKQAQQLPFMASDHALNVLIKMEPTESSVYPDLVLSVSSNLLQSKKLLFKNLKRGDEIQFKAKLMNLGNEFKMHHLHAMDFQVTGRKKELSEIVPQIQETLDQISSLQEKIDFIQNQYQEQKQLLEQLQELSALKQEHPSLVVGLANEISHIVKEQLLEEVQQGSSLKQQQDQISKIQQEEIIEIKYSMKDMNFAIEDRVTFADLHKELNNQASKYELQQLTSKLLEEYSTNEKAAEIESQLRGKIQEVSELMQQNYYSKQTMDHIFSNYKHESEKSFLNLPNFDDYQRKMRESLEKLQQISGTLDTRLKQVEFQSGNMSKQLLKKTEQEETNKIQEELKTLCKYDDLKELYGKIMPTLKTFEEKMFDMSTGFEQSMEIIRRYDEIIAEKASKTTVLEIYEYIKSYLPEKTHLLYLEKNEKDKEELKSEVQKLYQMLSTLSDNIGKDIFTAVRRATATLQNQNQQSKQGSGGMNDFDSASLKVLLNQKADKSEMDLLNDLKSNKIDTEQTMRGIDIMHKQMTHLIVLFVEFLKNNLKNHYDNEKSKEKKKLILLQQALSVCNWVNQFNPQNINNDDLLLPMDLQELTEYAKVLVSEFPKLDLTAEYVLKKNKLRDSYSIDASYQPAPFHKKNSPSNLQNSTIREISPSQQLNVYLANTLQSARYSKQGQNNQFYPLKVKQKQRNKIRYSSLKNEESVRKQERGGIPNYLDKLIKEQNAQNRSMMIKEQFNSSNQSKVLLSEDSNGSLLPQQIKNFQNQVNFPLIK